MGQRDIALSEVGLRQAMGAGAILSAVEIKDFMTSPLTRAMETADIIARHHPLSAARDRRLNDVDVGSAWQGLTTGELEDDPEYQRLMRGDLAAFPQGDSLDDARQRLVAAVHQGVSDNQRGANIVVVSHAAPLQLLLAHYLEMPLGNFHRLVLNPGSVSALSMDLDSGLHRVLGINWTSSTEVMVTVMPS